MGMLVVTIVNAVVVAIVKVAVVGFVSAQIHGTLVRFAMDIATR